MKTIVTMLSLTMKISSYQNDQNIDQFIVRSHSNIEMEEKFKLSSSDNSEKENVENKDLK